MILEKQNKNNNWWDKIGEITIEHDCYYGNSVLDIINNKDMICSKCHEIYRFAKEQNK